MGVAPIRRIKTENRLDTLLPSGREARVSGLAPGFLITSPPGFKSKDGQLEKVTLILWQLRLPFRVP